MLSRRVSEEEFAKILSGSFTRNGIKRLYDYYDEEEVQVEFDPRKVRNSWIEYTSQKLVDRFAKEYGGAEGPLNHAAGWLAYKIDDRGEREILTTMDNNYLVQILEGDADMTLDQFREWIENGEAEKVFDVDAMEPTEDEVVDNIEDDLIEIVCRYAVHHKTKWKLESPTVLAEDLGAAFTNSRNGLLSRRYWEFLTEYADEHLTAPDNNAAKPVIEMAEEVFRDSLVMEEED